MVYFRRVPVIPFARVGLPLISCVILLAACTTDRHVVTGGLIQKRKYRPGWHVDLGHRANRIPAAGNRIRMPEVSPRLQRASVITDPSDRLLASTQVTGAITASTAPPKEALDPSILTSHRSLIAAVSLQQEKAQDGQEDLMPKKKWNKLAVPVFVLGVGSMALGVLTTSTAAALGVAVVAVVLGAITLRRIRSMDEAGKGFALIGFMLGLFALLFTAITISTMGF